ncbi:hypothetical protein D9758_003897 [Tetrapyrgos nigripes]|uniref:RTA1-domain-containing protein n=1 Tax=Tetrapyrgos nigripes TaxID=182062 RepID=A0A8H5LRY5_9AGAR|nr:hypothetical protein D9758_003897 [Tetrapyrgos nigripes]
MSSTTRQSFQFFLVSFLALVGSSFIEGVEAQTSDDDSSTQNGHVDSQGRRIIAGFIPKNWASIIALVAYGVSGAIHWIHYFRIGKRHMLTLTIAMTCMAIGFIARIVYSGSPDSLGLYIFTTLFVLLSPCAFLAVDYILLERLAENLGHEVAKQCLFLSSSLIVKIFVWADVLTFLLQSSGGGLQTSDNESSRHLGSTIVIVGLVFQVVSFGLFTCLLLVFGFRVRTSYPQLWHVKTSQTIGSTIGLFKVSDVHDWRILFAMLCASCVGIIVRLIFRIFEYAQGFDGFLSTHEGYFYLLDALPLWLAMTQYCFFWPTRFNPRRASDKQGQPGQPGQPQEWVGLQSRGTP